jgi:hypothetical protein
LDWRSRRGASLYQWLSDAREPLTCNFKSSEYVVGGVLCLCGGVNQKRAIIAKLLQPAGNIGGLILWDSG